MANAPDPNTPGGDTQNGARLPTVICTTVVRSAHVGDSHGGVYIVDLESGAIRQALDWNDGSIDWSGRGGGRGLRGIAFHGDEIYIAASDEIFVYDRDFRVRRSIRNRYLGLCHEIQIVEGKLYLTATATDSILVYDIATGRFTAGYCVRNSGAEKPETARLAFGAFDPEGDRGPKPGDTTHINSVWVEGGVIYIGGVHLARLIAIDRDGPGAYARIPTWTHNARPFRGGVLANSTGSDSIGWFDRTGNPLRHYQIPQFPADSLEHADLPQDYARQAFGRGLCLYEPAGSGPAALLIGGSSPATLSVYRLETGERLKTVTLTMDVRNAVHGLEIWPFD
ncbi:MAG: hypothetical protein WD044_08075 [Dongiaceae bacterium]